MIKVTDDWLENYYFRELKEAVMDTNFSWYLNRDVSGKGDSHYQFIHQVYNNHECLSWDMNEKLAPLYRKLNAFQLVRVKFNLLPKSTEIIEHGMHRDGVYACEGLKIAVLYFDTNNGYTKFSGEQERKVFSQENRVVVFSNEMQHTGSTHTEGGPFRVVLNVNYFPKKK